MTTGASIICYSGPEVTLASKVVRDGGYYRKPAPASLQAPDIVQTFRLMKNVFTAAGP